MAFKTSKYLLRGSIAKLAWLLIALVIFTTLPILLLTSGYIVWGYSLSIIPVLLIASIIRVYGINSRKIAFMFDSMENRDFSFQFAENIISDSDRIMHQSLNRLKNITANLANQITDTERYYASVLSNTGVGIIIIDESGNIQKCNNSALNILGIPTLIHVDQLLPLNDDLPTILQQIPSGGTTTVRIKNEMGINAISLIPSQVIIQGKNLKIVSIVDIDEELESHEIEYTQRLTRLFSHEIMNYITPISSTSDTLLKLRLDNENLRREIATIKSMSDSLTNFAEECRSSSRIPIPSPESFNLRTLLNRIVKQMPDSDIIITCKKTINLLSDKSLIERALVNLIRNGINSKGSSINLSVSQDNNQRLIIDVVSNGTSISHYDAENIFMPFCTVNNTETSSEIGISRQIIKSLGGKLSLLSAGSMGNKVIFRIVLDQFLHSPNSFNPTNGYNASIN